MATEEQLKVSSRIPPGVIVFSIVPLVALIAALVGMRGFTGDWDRYEQYRRFWGGNPSEVYSHWLDMVLMSGNAASLAWLLSVEWFFRRRQVQQKGLLPLIRACGALGIVLSGMVSSALDRSHGEGTVLIAHLIFFIPILGCSYYLLRQFAAVARLGFPAVVALSGGYAVLHTAAQLYYEPSETGAPSFRIIPIWLGSVGLALIWALGRGIYTGWLRRFFARTVRVVRKPVVWGSGILLILAIGIPVTIHAKRLRGAHELMSIPWLNELETRLSDAFVAKLKREHASPKPARHSKIPVSTEAHTLLDSPHIKAGNSLRIYVPLGQADYLFLWANDRFEYCDIRELHRGVTVEMDHGFIETLIENGGNHQTGLCSILWSPYMAGRVLKDSTGKVKAICVINAP